MELWLILIPAFITAFAGTALAIAILKRPSLATQSALEDPSETEGSRLLMREESLSAIGFWAKVLERFDFIHIVRKRAAEAQLDWSVGRMTAMMLLSGIIAYAFLQQVSWLPIPGILAGMGFGSAIPYMYVLQRRRRRFIRFSEELPDALDTMCRALRAGNSLAAAIELIAYESPAPVSTEMRKTFEEWKLGMHWDQALDNLAARMPLPDVSLFVAAVKLHSKTGGKLGQVLENIGESMREANALRGEVQAVAAHGKMTAGILTVIPALIAAMMNMVNPGYLDILFTHPRGKDLVTAAICCVVLAHFVMRKIMDIRP
jgi:tight adherence protein B